MKLSKRNQSNAIAKAEKAKDGKPKLSKYEAKVRSQMAQIKG